MAVHILDGHVRQHGGLVALEGLRRNLQIIQQHVGQAQIRIQRGDLAEAASGFPLGRPCRQNVIEQRLGRGLRPDRPQLTVPDRVISGPVAGFPGRADDRRGTAGVVLAQPGRLDGPYLA